MYHTPRSPRSRKDAPDAIEVIPVDDPFGIRLLLGDEEAMKGSLYLAAALGLALWAAPAAENKREIIDTHGHFLPFPGEPGAVSEAAVRHAVEIMNDNGIAQTVDLSGGFGEGLKQRIALYQRVAPGRIVVFTNIDFSQVDDPQFPKKAMANVEEAHRAGARGLKSFKALGLRHKDSSGRLLRFDAVWTKCGELGMPVWFHIGDPAAFFRPPTPDNERYGELSVHPELSFYGPQFPAREALLTQAPTPKQGPSSTRTGDSSRPRRGTWTIPHRSRETGRSTPSTFRPRLCASCTTTTPDASSRG